MPNFNAVHCHPLYMVFWSIVGEGRVFFLLFRSKIISENNFLIFYKDVDTMERLTKLDRNFEPEMDATDVAVEETDASIVQGEDA